MQAPAEPKDSQKYQPGKSGFGAGGKLCLFGASVRTAAESARLAGYEVYAVDRFGDRDTLAVSKQHLQMPDLTQVSEDTYQAFRNSVVSLTNQMPFLVVGGVRASERLLKSLPLQPSGMQQLKAASQLRLIQILQEACCGTLFRIPVSWNLGDTNTLGSNLGERDFGSSPYLLKDLSDSGGLGVSWYQCGMIQGNSQIARSAVVQQWVPGRLYGSSFLSNGREVAILGTCQGRFTRIQDLPFVYTGSRGPISVDALIREALLQVAERLIRRTGFRGIFNLDWVKAKSERPYLIEVNPRWSGAVEILEMAWKRRLANSKEEKPFQSIIRWVVDAIQGDPLPPVLNQLKIPDRGFINTSANPNQDQPAPARSNFAHTDTKQLNSPTEPTQSTALRDRTSNVFVSELFQKRIIFSRGNQVFDPDQLSIELGPGESLHDLPAKTIRLRRGEPVCTLMIRYPQDQSSAPVCRYRRVVKSLSTGHAVDHRIP